MRKVLLPMAKSSIPASFRSCAGTSTASCDLPSVISIPILGTLLLDPASVLKLFFSMYVRAKPVWTIKLHINKAITIITICSSFISSKTWEEIAETFHWVMTVSWYSGGIRKQESSELPVRVFPPLYGRFLTASITASLVGKALRCHSILGSPLYWASPGCVKKTNTVRILTCCVHHPDPSWVLQKKKKKYNSIFDNRWYTSKWTPDHHHTQVSGHLMNSDWNAYQNRYQSSKLTKHIFPSVIFAHSFTKSQYKCKQSK